MCLPGSWMTILECESGGTGKTLLFVVMWSKRHRDVHQEYISQQSKKVLRGHSECRRLQDFTSNHVALYIIEFVACQLQLGLLRALVHQQVSNVQKSHFCSQISKSVGEELLRLSW